jgi:hypothetical protein
MGWMAKLGVLPMLHANGVLEHIPVAVLTYIDGYDSPSRVTMADPCAYVSQLNKETRPQDFGQ